MFTNSKIRWTEQERNTIANEVACRCLDSRQPIEALGENVFTKKLIVLSQDDIAAEHQKLDYKALGGGTVRSIVAAAIRLVTDHPEDYDMGERSEPTVLSETPVEEVTLDKIGMDGFMDLLTDALTHPVHSITIKEAILALLGNDVIRAGMPIVLNETFASSALQLAKAPIVEPVKPLKPIRGLMSVPKVPVLFLGLAPNQNESHTRHIDPKIKGNIDITFLGANIKLSQLKGYEMIIICAENPDHPTFKKIKEKVQSMKKVCRITSIDPLDIADDMESAYDQYRLNKNRGVK